MPNSGDGRAGGAFPHDRESDEFGIRGLAGGVRGVQQTAAELGLPWDESMQDWGIENADPLRVTEFASYYRDRFDSFDWGQQLWMGEFLLESANDALLEDIFTGIWPEEVVDLLLQHIHHEATQHLLVYLKNPPSPDHFRISNILRKRLKSEHADLLAHYEQKILNGG